MSTLTMSMASPKSLKRSYDEAYLEETVSASSTAPTQSPEPSSSDTKSHQSGLLLTSTRVTGGLALSDQPAPSIEVEPTPTPLPSSSQTPAKRSKLTFQEKEVRRIEKDFKAREKAEEKARKEEEKAKKEEEKKAKEAEKEEKRKAREQQAHAKQEEKRIKEEEKNRRSRNQLRLNAFFPQPSMPTGASSGSPTRESHSPSSSRRSSISEIHAMEAPRQSRSISSTPQKPRVSDYERVFQPFYVPSNTSLAPYYRFSRDEEGLAYVRGLIDESFNASLESCVKTEEGEKSFSFKSLKLPSRKEGRRSRRVLAIKDIMNKIEGTTSHPIDLTGPQTKKAAKNPLDLLKNVSMKYLKFAEDVRPPYIGTCTRIQGPQSVSQLARNPLGRRLPDMDYDYDSEAEWEEPVEGEDLNSEGEEDTEDEDDGEEMSGFLDDDGATDQPRAVKRRPVLGNQEPTCTGICWEGSRGKIFDRGLVALDWRLFKLDVLMENPKLPIDPYCNTYWQPKPSSNPPQNTPHNQSSLMEPPRLPLHPVNRQNGNPFSSPAKATNNPASQMKPAKIHRSIAPELMDDFKAAVQGNDLTKLGLLEVLKKQFPKQSKDAIKDTLESIAERVGPKPTDKKWVLKTGV